MLTVDISLFWDYLSSNPESLYQVMRLFSDLGTPKGVRHVNAWTGHTYRYAFCAAITAQVLTMALKVGQGRRQLGLCQVVLRHHAGCKPVTLSSPRTLCQQFISNQIQNFTNAEATAIAGSNPDYSTQDLFDAIENKTYPGWVMYAQVLTPKQAETFKYNVLDLTKYA